MAVNRKLRLAFVVGALEAAGSERQMLALAKRLPRDRFDVDFVLISRPGALAGEAEAGGARLLVVPPPVRRAEMRRPAVAARVSLKALNFVRLVRAGRYDIVDAWLFHAYLLAALTRPLTRVPVVVTGRRSLAPREAQGSLGLRLQRLSNRRADAIVANSPQARASAIEREGVEPDLVRVIRNGVEVPEPLGREARMGLRLQLGFDEDAFLVGNIANYLPGKGHELLLRAFARAAESRPQAHLILMGEGYLRDELERLIGRLGLNGRAVLYGRVDDPVGLLPAFDVIAQASDAEGLPNAVLEAAATGRPIVATPAGGTLEIIRDRDTGYLVPFGSPGELAGALEHVATHPDEAAAIGNAARAFVAREFSMDRFVTGFATLYEELARARGILPET
jgi:glycosyltransferase involved in cell wall biosynthesis